MHRIPIFAAHNVQVLASALDAGDVFLVVLNLAPSKYSLVRVPKVGGHAEVLAETMGLVTCLALDPRRVFFCDGGHIRSVFKAGSAVIDIVSDRADVMSLATDATHLYFATPTQIRRIRLDGSGADETWASASRGLHNLSVDESAVYWSSPESADDLSGTPRLQKKCKE